MGRGLVALLVAGLLAACGISGDDVAAQRDRRGEKTGRPTATTVADGARTTGGSSPASTSPGSFIGDHDFANATYRLSCGEDGLTEVTLVDGKWIHPKGPTFGFVDTFEVALLADVTADGKAEAVLAIGCGYGAGSVFPQVLVMASGPAGVAQLGQNLDGFGPQATGDGLSVKNAVYGPADPRCCPSAFSRTFYVLRNGSWVAARSEVLAGE